ITLLTGTAFIGGDLLLSGCKTPVKKGAGFINSNIALLDEVGETIIPTTDTPGAKATKIGAFMQTMVSDCYTQAEQDAFINGMTSLNESCQKVNGKPFLTCSAEQRKTFLESLEKEAKIFNKAKEDKDEALREAARKEEKEFINSPSHYYSMIKQLTLFGYFTSEIGATKALRHNPLPGKYDGAYPYKKGDKAWA
ncbi:MAG: gluconate 2-dehydrogenase subunit 3 family protein, partial [Ferruginibacter sp.]